MQKTITYNPWPNGKIPEHLQRPELKQLKDKGYEFDDAREVVDIWEKKVAKFFGANYGVSVDCCTNAMILSLRYELLHGKIQLKDTITIPRNTYVSASILLVHSGLRVKYDDREWSGYYKLEGSSVIDAAVRWKRNSYIYEPNSLWCISFQIKKMIPIGKGGMILTDNKEAYDWLKMERYDGRDMSLPYDHPNHIKTLGSHYYQTPEDCARGILLMDQIETEGDTGNSTMYPDVEKMLKI